jgi:hypothetical protein
MRSYAPNQTLPGKNGLKALVASCLLGVLSGAAVYALAQVLYVAWFFPIGVSLALAFLQIILFSFLRITHTPFQIGAAFLGGLALVLTYFALPYALLCAGWGGTQGSCPAGWSQMMQARAVAGNVFPDNFFLPGSGFPVYNFRLYGIYAWIYWLLEAVMLLVPDLWFLVSNRAIFYNLSTDARYFTQGKRAACFPLSREAQFFQCLRAKDLEGLSHLMLPLSLVPHPRLEVAFLFGPRQSGPVLMVLYQTRQAGPNTVKRFDRGYWEISEAEFGPFYQAIEDELSGRSPHL